MDMLWENAAPASGFPAQDLDFDAANYEYFAIVFRLDVSMQEYDAMFFCLKNVVTVMHSLYSSSGYTSGSMWGPYRDFTITDIGASFQNGVVAGTGAFSTVCIPYRIYGVKA